MVTSQGHWIALPRLQSPLKISCTTGMIPSRIPRIFFACHVCMSIFVSNWSWGLRSMTVRTSHPLSSGEGLWQARGNWHKLLCSELRERNQLRLRKVGKGGFPPNTRGGNLPPGTFSHGISFLEEWPRAPVLPVKYESTEATNSRWRKNTCHIEGRTEE